MGFFPINQNAWAKPFCFAPRSQFTVGCPIIKRESGLRGVMTKLFKFGSHTRILAASIFIILQLLSITSLANQTNFINLKTFGQEGPGSLPGGLLKGNDGLLYGTTTELEKNGAFFRVRRDGTD